MPRLSRSDKDYIEAIYILTRRFGSVRSIDVTAYLGHSKPSVTKAVQRLCAKGYLQKLDRELVFTPLGQSAAEAIFQRHCILTHALTGIGIDESTAIRDAQSMERVISQEAVDSTARAIRCQKCLAGVCPAGAGRLLQFNQ